MKVDPRDRRVQRTRQALHEALVELILEKGFEKVTVQDIIDRANVGRSTFYLHYRDTEDLLLGGFDRLWVLLGDHVKEKGKHNVTVWDLSLLVFQHAQSYTRVAKAVLGKQSGRVMFGHMQKHLSALMREALQGHWTEDKAVPLDFAVHHLASSLLSQLAWWVDHDIPYSAEHMNTFFQQLTRPGLEAIVATTR
jgi:AcrR family transcriptional regulator